MHPASTYDVLHHPNFKPLIPLPGLNWRSSAPATFSPSALPLQNIPQQPFPTLVQLLQHSGGWQARSSGRNLGNNAADGALKTQSNSHFLGLAGVTAAQNSKSLFLTIKQANMTKYTKGADLQNSTTSFLWNHPSQKGKKKKALIHFSYLQSHSLESSCKLINPTQSVSKWPSAQRLCL